MKLKITLVLLLVMISNADKAIDRQEGGYVGSGGQIAGVRIFNLPPLTITASIKWIFPFTAAMVISIT
jgi:hypothetical protein